MKTLYIVRGLPGSGKSTLAKRLVKSSRHFEADMFHIVDGEYKFDLDKIKEAHEWCQRSAEDAMKEPIDIAVSNTFTRRWEYQHYINMAKTAGFAVQVVDCHGEWKSIHAVPVQTLKDMRCRWENHEN